MNEINGKIFTNNKTGYRYMVLNEVIDCTNSREDQSEPMILYTGVGVDDTDWYVRDRAEFFIKFTEAE